MPASSRLPTTVHHSVQPHLVARAAAGRTSPRAQTRCLGVKGTGHSPHQLFFLYFFLYFFFVADDVFSTIGTLRAVEPVHGPDVLSPASSSTPPAVCARLRTPDPIIVWMLVQIRTQITESHSLHIVSPAPRSAERQDSPRQTSGSTACIVPRSCHGRPGAQNQTHEIAQKPRQVQCSVGLVLFSSRLRPASVKSDGIVPRIWLQPFHSSLG